MHPVAAVTPRFPACHAQSLAGARGFPRARVASQGAGPLSLAAAVHPHCDRASSLRSPPSLMSCSPSQRVTAAAAALGNRSRPPGGCAFNTAARAHGGQCTSLRHFPPSTSRQGKPGSRRCRCHRRQTRENMALGKRSLLVDSSHPQCALEVCHLPEPRLP